MLLYVNKNLKKVAYDSVKRRTIKPLIVRVVTGNLSISINYITVKYFTLTQTAIAN